MTNNSPDRHLLVSDLDGTLLGDTPALARFAEWYEPRRDRLALAYSSGRLYQSMLASIESSPLPRPDYVISGVGTEIRTFGNDTPWTDWHDQFTHWNAETVRALFEESFDCELQPEEFLSPWKVSYFAHNLTETDLAHLSTALKQAGLDARIVYSSERDLDILPAQTGKGSAARFLAEREGFTTNRLLGAGDSGNDATLIAEAACGIIVNNALPELKSLTGPTIYHSPHSFAAGVLDGLQHWLDSHID